MRAACVAQLACFCVAWCCATWVTVVWAVECTGYRTQADCTNSVSIGTLPPCGSVDSTVPQETFIILGDYGLAYAGCEGQVAQLVTAMEQQLLPRGKTGADYVITTGDNDYWNGGCETMEENIGGYYGRFFTPSSTCVDPVKPDAVSILESTQPRQRFFPTLGNHDWDTYAFDAGDLPYLQYFDYLNGSAPDITSGARGQYYHTRPAGSSGLVEVFAVNSNQMNESSAIFHTQQRFLQSALNASTAQWKLVTFHHPPYTTAKHDSPGVWMRWPYQAWGASLVLSGHEHVYERLGVAEDGSPGPFPYIVNGLGGHSWVYDIHNCTADPRSKARYNSAHGAMWAIATNSTLDLCFYSVANGGTLVDHVQVPRQE